MTMTRKDYEIIAGALFESAMEAEPGPERDAVHYTARKIAGHLRQDNGRFDEYRFLFVAGVYS